MNDEKVKDTEYEQSPAAETATGGSEPTEEKTRRRKLFKKHTDTPMLLALNIILVCAVILYIIVNIPQISDFIGKVNDLIAPIVIGLIIAYLCNPILKFYEFVVFKKLVKNHPRLCRALSLILTLITVLLAITLILLLIIPELIESIRDFFAKAEDYINDFLSVINNILSKIEAIIRQRDPDFHREFINLDNIKSALNNVVSSSEDLVDKLINSITKTDGEFSGIISSGWDFIYSFAIGLKNVFIGAFIGFYILGSKEKRYAQIMKVRKAIFSDESNKKITEVCTLINQSFGGYFKGSIIDSILVAIETLILFAIFRISDYNLLLAIFIGITNIIPVFGPFIGAIPTGFIVLITNPSKFWLFVILVLVIQQIDGNIIYPKILGDNTGISSLCVLIAITIMGSLFGILGMVIGVPFFAVIVFLIKAYSEDKLKEKGLSTDLADYYSKETIVSGEEDLTKHYNPFIKLIFAITNAVKKPFIKSAERRKARKEKRQNKRK